CRSPQKCQHSKAAAATPRGSLTFPESPIALSGVETVSAASESAGHPCAVPRCEDRPHRVRSVQRWGFRKAQPWERPEVGQAYHSGKDVSSYPAVIASSWVATTYRGKKQARNN